MGGVDVARLSEDEEGQGMADLRGGDGQSSFGPHFVFKPLPMTYNRVLHSVNDLPYLSCQGEKHLSTPSSES